MISAFLEEPVPAFIKSLPGPFHDYSLEELARLTLSKNFRLTMHEWSSKYMRQKSKKSLCNIGVTSIAFQDGRPYVAWMLVIGDAEDSIRMV